MENTNNISTFFDGFIDKWCSGDMEKTEFKDELFQTFFDANRELAKYNIQNGVVGTFESKQEKMLKKICEQLDKLEVENENIKKELNEKTKIKSKPKVSNLGQYASASAKKLAEDNEISEEDIEGTGSNGKITVKDIKILLPEKKTVKKSKKDEKHPCSGVKKDGDPCGRNGNNYIDDLDQWFCHSHKGEINSKQQQQIEEEVSDIESIKDGDIEYNTDSENFSEDDK